MTHVILNPEKLPELKRKLAEFAVQKIIEKQNRISLKEKVKTNSTQI